MMPFGFIEQFQTSTLVPLFGKSELVYENSVNLTTGEKTITESEINKK